jgi:hypothetical protein
MEGMRQYRILYSERRKSNKSNMDIFLFEFFGATITQGGLHKMRQGETTAEHHMKSTTSRIRENLDGLIGAVSTTGSLSELVKVRVAAVLENSGEDETLKALNCDYGAIADICYRAGMRDGVTLYHVYAKAKGAGRRVRQWKAA